ncbi:MAG TPA: RNA polymerase factor sigma-54, partial [bacterium]|nr:RNA polymerase factor sigma-54 [bacterium]
SSPEEFSADAEKAVDYTDKTGEEKGKKDDYDEIEAKYEGDSSENGEESFDADWENYFDDVSDIGYVGSSSYNSDEEKDSFESYTPEKISLFEHLQKQLMLVISNHNDYKIALHLISSIDENGYINTSVESAAEYFNTSVEKINKIRNIILNLEPPGICSLNLKEFILFQLKQKQNANTKWPIEIVEKHFDLIHNRKILEISRRMKLTPALVEKCLDDISRLAPYPAFAYNDQSGGNFQYIIPDVYFKKINSEWMVIINDDYLPYLRINPYYRKLAYMKSTNKQEKQFLKENIVSAENLLKAINQRHLTMYRVATRILDRQKDFFEKGISHLKPMVLREIAEDLKLHESTISRCTRGKYGQTPFGLFELKFFFSNGLPTTSGNEISSVAIKEKIKKIVSEEELTDPVSDIDIWKKLTYEGIIAERKTISNYRDEIGNLPKHLRRRIFKKKV